MAEHRAFIELAMELESEAGGEVLRRIAARHREQASRVFADNRPTALLLWEIALKCDELALKYEEYQLFLLEE